MPRFLPAVAIVCDFDPYARHALHGVQEKYVACVRDGADALPLLVPAAPGARALAPQDISALLDVVDGIFLPGGISNVAPALYGGDVSLGLLHDTARDAVSISLLQAAITRSKPVFGICRGLQEINVALGGSLHQQVQLVPGMLDHREASGEAIERQFAKAHEVRIVAGGLLHEIIGEDRIMVNSLHQQGIERLADALRVEAMAPDGLIEAVSGNGRGYIVGTQWHPEWRFAEDPVSQALFRSFGKACRDHSCKT